MQSAVNRWIAVICTAVTMLSMSAVSHRSLLRAQADPSIRNVPHPRVALVLSGGSAKAFAHIGVLEVIEQMGIPVDLVTGASMGAIVGGLYAAGYSPRELEKLIRTEDWGTFFKNPTVRRLQRLNDRLDDARFTVAFPLEHARPNLPAGVISRQSIAEHLDRYLWPVHDVTDFMRLPTPFAALATDLKTGDAVLLQHGSLAQAVEGSAAIPGAFAPLTLADGRTVVDGAVNRNLPAEDARRLGADILICVDVTERIQPLNTLHSLIDVVDQTVAFRVQMSNAVERPLCNVIIEPEISGLSSGDYSDGPRWVDRGRAAALEHRGALEAIADSARRLRGAPVARRMIPEPDSVFVSNVSWSRVSVGADAIASGAITVRDSTWVTQRQAEGVAARVFATGRFDQVSYRIVPRGTEHDLVFDLAEGNRDQLGVGVRYNTPEGVGLLASAQVADLFSPGSMASVTARLGERQQFDARDVLGQGLNSPFLQIYSATSTRMTLRTLNVPGAAASAVLDVQQVAAELQRTLFGGFVAGVEVSHEWSHDGTETGRGPFALQTHSLNIAAVTLSRDTRDRIPTPTRGTSIFWRSEAASPLSESGHSFTRQTIDAEGALPIAEGLSLLGSAHFGTASGPDLPLHDWFFLGGSVQSAIWQSRFIPFMGLKPQSIAGQSVRVVQGGAQLQAPADFVIAVNGTVGNAFDPAPGSIARTGYIRGLGATLSRAFAPGLVSITVASRSLNVRPTVEVGFGAFF